MSVIPVNPQVYSEYAGTYHLEAQPNSDYLIVSLEAKDSDDQDYSTLSISGTPLTNAGVLNNGKYSGAITSGDFSVSSSNPTEDIRINSVPVRYAVTYHRNHSGSDSTLKRTFFNKAASDDRSAVRDNVTQGGNTYTFSDVTLTFANISGWSAPTNKHFLKWCTTASGTGGTDYAENVSVTSLTADTDLYAIYANDDTYTINVYFDSTEVNTPTIAS